jgi:hypothetical protein
MLLALLRSHVKPADSCAKREKVGAKRKTGEAKGKSERLAIDPVLSIDELDL